MALFGLGERGDVIGEAYEPTGLVAQHGDRLGVKGFHAVFEGLHVCLENGDGCADLVGEIAQQPAASGLDRFEPGGHLVEGFGEGVEVLTQVRRGDPNVVAPVGDGAGRRRYFSDRSLQPAGQIPGHHQRGEGGHRQGHSHRDDSGVPVGLLGVELLIGSGRHPGAVKVFAEQRWPDDGGDYPRRDGAGDQHHGLCEQQPHADAGNAPSWADADGAGGCGGVVTGRCPSGIRHRAR